MASNGIPFLGRLKQLLASILPMQKERASAILAPIKVQPTTGVHNLAPNTQILRWFAITVPSSFLTARSSWKAFTTMLIMQAKHQTYGGKQSV